MSTDAAGDAVCAMDTGKDCDMRVAVWAGKAAPGRGGAMLSRSLANLSKPSTRFASMPSDIATLAAGAPGAAHCCTANAYNCALRCRREPILSDAIVSARFFDGRLTDAWRTRSLALRLRQSRSRAWTLSEHQHVTAQMLPLDANIECGHQRPRPMPNYNRLDITVQAVDSVGGPRQIRTVDQRIKSPLLYQLS